MFCECALKTRAGKMIDLTPLVKQLVKKSGAKSGMCFVIVPHTTCGLILQENELGVRSDLKELSEELVSDKKEYKHKCTSKDSDDNGYAHLRTALFAKQSVALAIRNENLCLGEFQSILFIEYDETRPRRERKVQIKIMEG